MIRFLGCILIVWLVGFYFFIHPNQAPLYPDQPEVLVVWTGGAGRIQEGLRCLEKNPHAVLFISGVHEDVALKELTVNPQLKERIFLGYHARTTRENALETKAWLEKHPAVTVRLITAHYHMRRSLIEFKTAMPNQLVIPHPIIPLAFQGLWWFEKKTLFLALREYHKLMIVYAYSVRNFFKV